MSQSKFIIEWGSHQTPPTVGPAAFVSTQAQFDRNQNAQIDGSVFILQNNAGVDTTSSLYSTTRLNYDDFSELILACRARNNVGWGKASKNVFLLQFAFQTIDWVTGNTGAFVHNFSLAARIARDAKLWGILIDGEPYSTGIWNHYFMPSKALYSADRYNAEVYRVAKEIGQNWMRIWPDMNIVIQKTYSNAYETIDVEPPILNTYQFYVSWLDGLLDGIGPGRTVTTSGMVGRPSYGKTVFMNSKNWQFFNVNERQSAIDDLKGTSQARYKGSSQYFDQIVTFGKLLWIDFPGTEGGRIYPDFDNTTPANSHYDQDQFVEYMSFCLAQLDYMFIFNQYYNFVSNVYYSLGVLNPLYTEAIRSYRTSNGMA